MTPLSRTAHLGPTLDVDLSGLRRAGAAMVGLGVVLPLLPHHPGLPCPLRTITGVPCPFCGLTTAVERGLTGRVVASLGANPLGLVAIVVAIVLVMVRRAGIVRIPLAVVVPVLLGAWAWELRRYGLL